MARTGRLENRRVATVTVPLGTWAQKMRCMVMELSPSPRSLSIQFPQAAMGSDFISFPLLRVPFKGSPLAQRIKSKHLEVRLNVFAILPAFFHTMLPLLSLASELNWHQLPQNVIHTAPGRESSPQL